MVAFLPPSLMSCPGASHASDLPPQNENSLRSNSLAADEKRMNENMVRCDEILSLPFIITPPVQRAACALHFVGSVPSRISRNHPINQISTHSFKLISLSQRVCPLIFPLFSKTAIVPAEAIKRLIRRQNRPCIRLPVYNNSRHSIAEVVARSKLPIVYVSLSPTVRMRLKIASADTPDIWNGKFNQGIETIPS